MHHGLTLRSFKSLINMMTKHNNPEEIPKVKISVQSRINKEVKYNEYFIHCKFR